MKTPSEQLHLDLDGTPDAPVAERRAEVPAAGAATAPAAGPRETRPAEAALPDADARRRIAEDLETNLLVEAGAGSGKTTALVSRMVGLVREGAAEVTEIAAVTFTRKAAGELRERFQEALERERERDDLLDEPRARLEAALQDLDRAFMGTIHAFCARLLRERPLDAGLDPAFVETTAPEAEQLAARFWGLHLERLAAAEDPVLWELEDAGLAPTDLRALYDELRENLDVEFPLQEEPPPDPEVLARVRAELDQVLDEAARLLARKEPQRGWDDLQRRLRSVLYVRRYRPWRDDRVFLDALAELGSRAAWSITKSRWADDAAGRGAADRLKDRINRLLDGEGRRLLEGWWAHRYALALRFALDAARALEAHRLSSGRLDFQDLLVLAARLLRRSATAREDLGRRWKRILVDEFQDTDPIQGEVLFLLASDPGADGGDWTRAAPRPGALFVVGDPKQSIYRFRRADIALYARVRARFRELGDVLDLVSNFRSGEPVAALVNAAFAPPAGFPERGDAVQAAFAPLLPQPRPDAPPREGVFRYDVRAGRGRDAVSRWSAAALADWIATRVGPDGDRRPGDFLILTHRKEALESYARALEARNLPVRVSGAGVGVDEEVAELRLLLEALVDPGDPSRTLAVLVGSLFGLDHEQLLAHAEAGRGYDLRAARPGVQPGPVEAALTRLREWWEFARGEPADVVVGRIASQLGLLAHAAAGELGSVRAGALAFVLDAVRAAGSTGDTSLTGALEALDTALRNEETEAPLEPGRSDTIRLMNLHKAKGLEAKVVVLAAPRGRWDAPVERHIERTADGRARGWLTVERRDGWSTRVLARPRGWTEKEAAERAFREAEDLRLLYVAATRAGEELVVARNPEEPDRSPWRRLDPWLDALAVPLDLAPADAPPRERLETSAGAILEAVGAAEARRVHARTPTFAFQSVTRRAKDPPEAGRGESVADAAPPLEAVGGPAGYAWGSAVHGVLEAAARGLPADRLRPLARSLLLELDRPVAGGEPAELEALLATVEGVTTSELWRRARRSGRTLAEVPFALRQDEGEPITYLEGVIDLAFREPDGWVVVDYKTDRGDDPGFPRRREAYRAQLRAYALAWERLTGEGVKERLLWFVRTGQVERVEAE